MISLFNRFDSHFFSLQYIVYLIIIAFVFNLVIKIGRFNLILNIFTLEAIKFFSTLKPKAFTDFRLNLINSFFIILLILNFSSVLSFSFSFTSQTSIVIFIAFSLWVSFFIFQVFNNVKGFLSHCVPEGTPIYLTWFLFLIELVRNSIRPITLSVRLVANILAGHLLIILLSELVLKIIFLFPLYILLNLVELFVALIQSYIFVTIVTLYFSDTN